MTAADGKRRITDVADTEYIANIVLELRQSTGFSLFTAAQNKPARGSNVTTV